MAESENLKLSDLTEDRLIAQWLDGLPAGRNVVVGPGDDCAVVQSPGARDLLLLKTDCVVEGVHYLPEEDPARVGWKALCRTLSDIAAMAGEPRHALVTVFSPPERTVSYWQGIYDGLRKAAAAFHVGIVGGETARARQAAISITTVGRVEPARLVTRSMGRPGDRLFVTGTLGGSLNGKHLDFQPRIEAGRWIGAHGYASAMMDLSDGLAADLPRLASASGCAFEIDSAAIPRTRGCTVTQALRDGEDYELLFAAPSRVVGRLRRGWSTAFPDLRLTEIGCLCAHGTSFNELPLGFDHFFGCQPPVDRAS